MAHMDTILCLSRPSISPSGQSLPSPSPPTTQPSPYTRSSTVKVRVPCMGEWQACVRPQ